MMNRMMRGRAVVATVSAVSAVLVVSACGGSKPAEVPPPIQSTAPVAEEKAAPAPEPERPAVVVADFATGDRKNALGGEFGAWQHEAKSSEEVVAGAGADKTGAWKITYDITPPGSFSGAYMKLANLDASSAKNFVISVKGEGDFSPDFILELKTGEGAAQKTGRHVIKGVTKEYRKIEIPLTSFAGLMEFKPLSELAIVFDEQTCPVKTGTYYIDTIEFQ